MKKLLKLTSIFFFSAWLLSCKSTNKIQSSKKNKSIEQSMLSALAWQQANLDTTKPATDWVLGVYYTGLARAHQATNNKKYLDALVEMGKRNDWKTNKRFYHADDLPICYAYTYLKSIGNKEVDITPTDNLIKDHLYKPYPWRDGSGGSKPQVILWWWCDALFMAPPVITAYAKLTNNDSYLTEMDKYYKQSYGLLYDKDEDLFARDTRFIWTGAATDKKEANGKKVFWSRGNGWVLGGLPLILDNMPKDYKNRKFYEGLFKVLAERIKSLQPKDGLWRSSLLSSESFDHGEVSGSGLFTFALAWGVNNGLLSKDEYEPAVIKAWDALQKCQQANGKVGWVQSIGADPRPATADSWQYYGTGAFLLAGSEVMKLAEKK